MKKYFLIGIAVLLTGVGIFAIVLHNCKSTELVDKMVDYRTCNEVIRYGDYSIMLDQYAYYEDRQTIAGGIRIRNKKQDVTSCSVVYAENYILVGNLGNEDENEKMIIYFDQSGQNTPYICNGTVKRDDNEAYLTFWYTVEADEYDNRIYIFADPEYTATLVGNYRRINPDMDRNDGYFELDAITNGDNRKNASREVPLNENMKCREGNKLEEYGDYVFFLDQLYYDCNTSHIVGAKIKIENDKKKLKMTECVTGEDYCELPELGIRFQLNQEGDGKATADTAVECVKGDMYVYLWYRLDEGTYEDSIDVIMDNTQVAQLGLY